MNRLCPKCGEVFPFDFGNCLVCNAPMEGDVAEVTAPGHSSECRQWFLAFTHAKLLLEKAQRDCPCCLSKKAPHR